MAELTPIIVGVDFSPGSRAALEQAVRIGARTGRPVRAAHVIDQLVLQDLEAALPAAAATLRDDVVADARRAWDRLRAGLADAASVPIDITVSTLLPGLLRAAQPGVLMILGAFGDRPPDVGPGSIASACVRKSPADVLLVRSTQAGPFRRVVAAVDFSATSLRALERAAWLAALDGAELRAIHVFDPPWHRLHYRAPTPEVDPHFQKQYRDALERRLRAVASEAAKPHAGLAPVCELIDEGRHRSTIAEYALRVGADLVVLGTRGRTNLRDVLLGSTAEKTLEETPCSILAVKPEGFTHPLADAAAPPAHPLKPKF